MKREATSHSTEKQPPLSSPFSRPLNPASASSSLHLPPSSSISSRSALWYSCILRVWSYWAPLRLRHSPLRVPPLLCCFLNLLLSVELVSFSLLLPSSPPLLPVLIISHISCLLSPASSKIWDWAVFGLDFFGWDRSVLFSKGESHCPHSPSSSSCHTVVIMESPPSHSSSLGVQ